MSSRETLSRPYARAAFELGKGQNALSDWSAKLGFAAAVAARPEVVDLIGNPRITAEQLKALFLPNGEAADGAFALFVAQLAANRRLALMPDIAARFEQLKRESERVLKVRVKTAVALEARFLEARGDILLMSEKRAGRVRRISRHWPGSTRTCVPVAPRLQPCRRAIAA